MIKNEVFIVGLGLGGEKVGFEFQQRNYPTYLVNGSGQDNKTLPEEAKDVLVLEGYDGLAGDRSLAFKALKSNKSILQKVLAIEKRSFCLLPLVAAQQEADVLRIWQKYFVKSVRIRLYVRVL